MKRYLSLISILAVVAGFAACQKDGGNDEVALLKVIVLDKNGNIDFDETTVSGLYQIGVDSKEDAADLAGLYAGSGFKGENYTRTLSGNKGTVKVTKGENGVFYSVRFAVEGIPSFTLDIRDLNGENGPKTSEGDSGTYHKCGVCNRTWRSHSNVCPWTSKHKS